MVYLLSFSLFYCIRSALYRKCFVSALCNSVTFVKYFLMNDSLFENHRNFFFARHS